MVVLPNSMVGNMNQRVIRAELIERLDSRKDETVA